MAVITGSRAEYGILKPVIRTIDNHPHLDLSLVVTGMHLSEEFGYTIEEIERDGLKIDVKINTLHTEDTGAAMSKSIGRCTENVAEALEKVKPDILLLLGDRGEMLAGAVAATYMNLAIAHVHGGEVSGNVDESVRHCITKLAHIHFPATQESADRIIKMGEAASRVFVVGAPGLDSILTERLVEPDEVLRRFGLTISEPIILVLQHPVVSSCNDAPRQIRETLEAIAGLDYQTVLIYPNSDAGGRAMTKVIKEYESHPKIRTFKSISHIEFLSLMRVSSVLIGNSSSGIIEAPSFGLPVVNIGPRQRGRQRAENVIDVDSDREEVKIAVNKALWDQGFTKRARNCTNPYGDGKASERIVKILSEIKISPDLLEKRITY